MSPLRGRLLGAPRAASLVSVLPVAALAALVAGAVVARVAVPRSPAADSTAASVECTEPAAAGLVAPAPGSARAPGLTGPTPPPAARVPEGSPRVQHGDAARTHRSAAVGPRSARLVFAAAVGGAVAAQVTCSPDEQTLYVATLAGALVALDRAGRERFRVDLGERSYTAPAVAGDGTVYVGSDAGKLFAVSPAGQVSFRVELGGEVDVAPLLLPSGEVFVVAGRTLAWIDRRGNVVRRLQAKRKVFTAPALAGDLVVFGAQDDHAYGVRVSTGAVVFRTPLGADVDGSPAVADDGSVYFGTDAGEIAHLAPNGGVLGRVKVGGYVRGPLSIARNGDVVVGTYGPAPRLVRVRGDAVAGAFALQGTGSREFGVHGGALEDASGTLYFGAQDDEVYGVSPEGARVLAFRTGGDVDAPLTLLRDGTLVVPSEDGRVYALAAR
ncbi:MAG: PQQ-like beta-propeller repeat protein [Myxococcales bacterium]|nr:PQQ-like beta-propeller repeat protein [Myxococcales bacterium]